MFNRSADLKKVGFFAGSVWTPEKTQGEVGGDQKPLGDTWRHPMAPKIFFSIKIFLVYKLLLVKIFKFYKVKIEKWP